MSLRGDASRNARAKSRSARARRVALNVYDVRVFPRRRWKSHPLGSRVLRVLSPRLRFFPPRRERRAERILRRARIFPRVHHLLFRRGRVLFASRRRRVLVFVVVLVRQQRRAPPETKKPTPETRGETPRPFLSSPAFRARAAFPASRARSAQNPTPVHAVSLVRAVEIVRVAIGVPDEHGRILGGVRFERVGRESAPAGVPVPGPLRARRGEEASESVRGGRILSVGCRGGIALRLRVGTGRGVEPESAEWNDPKDPEECWDWSGGAVEAGARGRTSANPRESGTCPRCGGGARTSTRR